MDYRNYFHKYETNKYENNILRKNIEEIEKNDSSLSTIYSFISSYVLKEESNYDEIESKYTLLEDQKLENGNDLNKIGSKYSNEKVDYYYYEEKEEKYESGVDENIKEDENKDDEEDKMEKKLEIKQKKKKKSKEALKNGNSYDYIYEENIFKDEKQLSRQMSYYNDAYYYTSEMIYKDNRKNKEKFALYLRLISLFFNIIIGIYLIVNFPHTNNKFEMKFSNKYAKEHEKLIEIIRNNMGINKDNQKFMSESNINYNTLVNEDEVSKNKKNNKNTFLNTIFRNSEVKRDNKSNNNKNSNKKNYPIKKNELNKINDSITKTDKYYDVKDDDDVNNLLKEIDIVNLIDDENIMNIIYSEMNKIYNYSIYSFFGELLVISIILFSLFILKIFIKDNNKISVILTLFGILHKIFCYFFAHYVLFMGIYILSIYCNIYIHRDIYENTFNFFCYHYVYNNLHIHLLMLFYAFQNIIFTINDAVNCIRMMFILIKHIIIKIYEKLTCKNFITFYELKEDKSFLSVNFLNKMKNNCNMYGKCCRDKNCGEIDIDEVHELEYNKNKVPFTNSNEKLYCENLDIKTYEQSLLNMRNPIFK